MGHKPEIIGLGEIALDWVSEVDHFPAPDEKVDALSENHFVGGVTTNFLTGVAKLGVMPGFLGAVGDDDYGDFLLMGLKRAGVDSSRVVKRDKSAVNFIIVTKSSGEKVIIQSPHMQSTKLRLEEIQEDYFEYAKVLHTTAIHSDLTKKCIKIAKKRGITVSLDLEKQIAVRGIDILKPIIKDVDILLPQKEGARVITGANDIYDAANILLDWGPKIVVMTLGKEGCLVFTKEIQEKIPAYPTKVIDTTGAGDAFCASIIVAHCIKKMDIIEAARFANAVSAIKIKHLGATSGLPTWDEARAFQAKH